VAVVGYGTQRKEAVTGSVASISGDKVRDVPASNISRNLQGRVAGVDMSQTSSKPGSAMQIRIRGTRSLNASNDPLVVLDGIPFAGSIGDIDPNSIESKVVIPFFAVFHPLPTPTVLLMRTGWSNPATL
jgi:TonB-dependent starch-binding outer membrane protein SusC